MYNNMRGVKSKIHSIKKILEEKDPVIMAVAETKLNKGDPFEIEGYIVERVDRDENDGGGVLLAYKEGLKNVVTNIKEERENCEILWVKLDNGKTKLKIAVAYMPQEKEIKNKELKAIYKQIEDEVMIAKRFGESVLIMGDLNCKIGDAIVGNTDEVTKGGRMLLELCQNTGLTIVNKSEKCSGTWTRAEQGVNSILDYVLVWEDDMKYLDQMVIDEARDFTPYAIDGQRIVYSDHAAIELSMNWMMKIREEKEQRTYMSPDDYKLFEDMLQAEQVSEIISEEKFDECYAQWNDKIMSIVHKCSKKKKKKKQWKSNRLLTQARKCVQKELRGNLGTERRKLLITRKNLLTKHIHDEDNKRHFQYVNKVVDKIKSEGGVNSDAFWELMRRLQRRKQETGHAIINDEGIRIENKEEIKKEYIKYFNKLLTAEKPDHSNAESAVQRVMSGMELIASRTPPKMITSKEITDVVYKLKKRKAKDKEQWKNELMINGGDEMIKSLVKIFRIVDRRLKGPEPWNRVSIKTLHKNGSKLRLPNKRGIFLTNVIGKVFERVVKGRNRKTFTQGLSPNQTGGQPERGTIDHSLTVMAIIERNKYLKQTTYLTFADVQKCFDKLWLQDGIKDLWLCGTDLRDAVMIKNLNAVAHITIDTPVGITEEFSVENIVKQGTVYAVDICAATMDHINKTSYGIKTMYGPDLEINALAFVDDVASGGNVMTANNTVESCAVLEQKKKIVMNTKPGKSAHMKVDGKRCNYNVTKAVKNGLFGEVDEYKHLGVWLDTSGSYMINIKKNVAKMTYMKNNIKALANGGNMGNLATSARLKMFETTVIPAILYGVEAFPYFTKAEEKQMEIMQGRLLKDIMDLPHSTPYEAILLEFGMPTMKSRVEYRKLMLYHNIVNSDERRIVKKVIEEQRKMDREGTWFDGIKKILDYHAVHME